MKTVDLKTIGSVTDLLDLAAEETLLLKTSEGREFILAEVDDFDAEIETVRQNRGLLEFLDQRSQEPASYSIAEARKRLKLG